MMTQTAWQFLIEFAQVSLLAFGGASAALPEMHRRVVEEHGWVNDEQFSELFGLAQAAPGPNVLVASLIGWKVAQFAGAVAGLIGMVGPSSLLAYAVTRLWDRQGAARWREWLLAALVPITIGLTLASGYLLTLGAGRSAGGYLLIAATAAATLWTPVHPLWCIAIGAALGYAGWI